MKMGLIMKIAGGIVGAAFLGFVLIQFIPVDRSNPPVVQEPNWDSPQTKVLMERACYDCHSNQTKWPAYSYVAPVSLLVADHVQEGRHEFNLSDWGRNPGEGEEMIEEIQKGEMPMASYLLLHPEARLTDAEKDLLIAGIEATFGMEGDEAGEHGEHSERYEDGETEQNN